MLDMSMYLYFVPDDSPMAHGPRSCLSLVRTSNQNSLSVHGPRLASQLPQAIFRLGSVDDQRSPIGDFAITRCVHDTASSDHHSHTDRIYADIHTHMLSHTYTETEIASGIESER